MHSISLFLYLSWAHAEPVGQSETGASEGRIPGCYRAYDDSYHSQSDADAAHGLGAYVVDGRRLTSGQHFCETCVESAGDLVESASGQPPI